MAQTAVATCHPTRHSIHRAGTDGITRPGSTTGPTAIAIRRPALCLKGPPRSEAPHRAEMRVTGQDATLSRDMPRSGPRKGTDDSGRRDQRANDSDP